MRVWIVATCFTASLASVVVAQWPPVTPLPQSVPAPVAQPTLPSLQLAPLGFGAKFRNRCWVPLRCRVENPGAERTGLLAAEAREEFSGQVTVYSRPVWLPAQSQRLFEFPAFCDLPINWDPLKSGAARTALKLKLTDGGIRVWDENTALGVFVPEEALLVLGADTRWPSYKMLDDLTVGTGKRPVARAVISPADLPRRPIDYRGVDVLILGALENTELSPLQVAALRDWVSGGGLLFLVPGATGTLTDFDALGDMVPVQYLAATTVSSLPALRRWGTPVEFPDGLRFVRMVSRGGQVMLGDQGSPLIVRHHYGLGRVVALAFDAGDVVLQRWPGTAAMWTEWLGWRPQFFQDTERVVERAEQTDMILSNLAGIKVVTQATMKYYLGGLVIGLVVVLGVFRWTRAPEWGWVATAVLALVGGVVVAVAAQRWKAQPQAYLNEVDTAITSSGDSRVNLYAVFGLFSPRETTYRLDVADDTDSIQPGRTATVLPQTFTISYEDKLTVKAVPVAASGMRPLSGRATLTGQATPVVKVQLGGDGLNVAVNNPAAQPLTDCFFKFNRLVLPLGDVAGGGHWQARGVQGSEPGAELQYSSRMVPGTEDELHQLFRQIFFPDPLYSAARRFSSDVLMMRRFRTESDEPALFGWRDRPLFPVTDTIPATARRGIGLWAVRTTTSYAGPQLLIPKGVMPLVYRNKGAVMTEQAEGRFGGNYGQQLLVEFKLPPGCPALRIEEATVIVAFRASAFVSRVSIAPRELVTAAEPDSSRFVWLAGDGPRYQLREPERFYNPASRSFLVAVDIEPIRRQSAGEAWQTSINYWQVRDLDMQLKGVTP